MADEKKMEEQIKDIACSKNLKSFQRNRYFYGKLLTVRDFEEEQRYFIEKQRLINRLIHGEGVVCGLKVEKVEDKDGFIRITPGVALDCCGREIVVPEPVKIDLSKKIALEDFGDEETITRWVTIRYSACGKEPVPAYSAESSCEETCCYSRIMEGYEIDILEEKPEECTSYGNGKICDVWSDLSKVNEYVNIWHQKCPAFEEKPLILAKIEVKKESDSIEINNIDNAIVKEEEFNKKLVYSNPRLYELINCVEKELKAALEKDLPKIKEISWEHDKEYDWSDEQDRDNFLSLLDKLTITFDRAMNKETINHITLNVFVIPYFTGKLENFGNVEELIVEAKKIYFPVYFIQEDEGNQISFKVGYPTSNENRKKTLKTHITNKLITAVYSSRVFKNWDVGIIVVPSFTIIWRMFIQLKGDFVFDVNGNPLDANYLKAELPTGNGTPGGLFESWLNIRFDFNKAEDTKKVINTKPGISVEEVATNVRLSRETTHLILNALAKNKVIYSKEGEYYPLPDPRKTMIVYDGKYNYLKESAEKLKVDLRDKGIIAEIKSSDELTDEDKNKYEIVLLRGKDIKSATAEKMREVESKVDWDKSKGDTEIIKNPYIENTNVFIIGGKDKKSVGTAINKFLEHL
ncbi:MAG: hypothetical protein DRP68_06565 [Candidatus Omnitrophota bacterium]|nr:MAG: hypothetical protein DRP68_06565 [Candidatus Omnitrophota bacterium]